GAPVGSFLCEVLLRTIVIRSGLRRISVTIVGTSRGVRGTNVAVVFPCVVVGSAVSPFRFGADVVTVQLRDFGGDEPGAVSGKRWVFRFSVLWQVCLVLGFSVWVFGVPVAVDGCMEQCFFLCRGVGGVVRVLSSVRAYHVSPVV